MKKESNHLGKESNHLGQKERAVELNARKHREREQHFLFSIETILKPYQKYLGTFERNCMKVRYEILPRLFGRCCFDVQN